MQCKERKFEVESEFAKGPNKKSLFLHCIQKHRSAQIKSLLCVIPLSMLHVIRQGRCGRVFEGGVWGFLVVQCFTLRVL